MLSKRGVEKKKRKKEALKAGRNKVKDGASERERGKQAEEEVNEAIRRNRELNDLGLRREGERKLERRRTGGAVILLHFN